MAISDLLTEQRCPASEGIERLGTAQILSIINAEDAKVAQAVGAVLPAVAAAVEATVAAIKSGGRLFYIGSGTSGRLGVLDAAECPPTFNVPPDLVRGIIAGGERALSRASEVSEDDMEAGRRDLAASGFSPADVLVGISTSGRAPYVLGAVAYARELNAVTIGISCSPDSELARAVGIAITPLTGPEVVAGSTRMKAGTATKMVLNMLSTAAMIKLGHVYGNLMVNVQPKNLKLKDRAQRIVARAAGIDQIEAAEALEAAGGEVKTAILMKKLNIDRDSAEKRLTDCGGRISEALQNG
jgi:N-acetylmuramic acid 6-phosphate etherase